MKDTLEIQDTTEENTSMKMIETQVNNGMIEETTFTDNRFTIKLIKTMLEKSIMDATKPIQDWYSKALCCTFDGLEKGECDEYDAEFIFGAETTIKFYKSKSRGDKRFSIKGLRKYADVGDYLTVQEAYKYSENGEGGVHSIIISIDEPEVVERGE